MMWIILGAAVGYTALAVFTALMVWSLHGPGEDVGMREWAVAVACGLLWPLFWLYMLAELWSHYLFP